MYVPNMNIGWNAGARSRQVCVNDCQCTFSVPTNVAGVVCGLNTEDKTADFREIKWALFFTKSNNVPFVYVYELGVQKYVGGAYASSDIFTIRRVEGVVTYWKGNTLLYTSASASSGAIFMDSSLYASGDEIK